MGAEETQVGLETGQCLDIIPNRHKDEGEQVVLS